MSMAKVGRFQAGRLNVGRFWRVGDETTATLSATGGLSVTATGANAVSIDIALPQLDGALLVYVSRNAAPPSRADWISGNGAVFHSSQNLNGSAQRLPGPQDLEAATEYHVHAALAGSDGSFTAFSQSVSTHPRDTAVPLLSVVSVDILNETTLGATFDTNEMNGVIFWVLTTDARTPDPEQIKSGLDHAGQPAMSFGKRTVFAAGPQTRVDMPATQGVEHWVHVLHEDAAMNASSVFTDGPVTPRPVNKPVVTSLELADREGGEVAAAFNSDTPEGTAFVALTLSKDPPTPGQVKDGKDHTGAPSVRRAAPVTSTGPQYLSVFGAAPNSEYWGHVVQEDVHGNLSDVATSFTAERTFGGTVYLTLLGDGEATGDVENAVLTGGQPDHVGGWNAVSWSNDGAGGAQAAVVYRTPSGALTFADGLTRIHCVLKTMSAATPRLWITMRPEGISASGAVSIDITDDATPESARVGTKSPVFLETDVRALGGGYFLFRTVFNGWDMPDRTGRWSMTMASSDNGTQIDNTQAGNFQVLLHNLSFEALQ